jgi:hypothetical protein
MKSGGRGLRVSAIALVLLSALSARAATGSIDLIGAPPTNSLTSRDLLELYPAAVVAGPHRGDQRIIVLGYANPLVDASVRDFRRLSALPACVDNCLTHRAAPAAPVGPGNPATETPTTIQQLLPALYATEAAMASCPTCHVTYVEAASSAPNDVGTATAYAVRALGSRLIVVPFNAAMPRDTDAQLQRNFYNVRGLTLLVAGVDDGSRSRAGMPATSPTALAVGGTTVIRRGTSWASSSWSGTSATCENSQPQPNWQRARTDCIGRAVTDISAAANPDVTPFAAVVSNGTASAWKSAGGTAVAAGILAGWAARSRLAGILTPAWLYAHPSMLQDVTTGPTNRCLTDSHNLCTDRPQLLGVDDCSPDLASPRTCVVARGWDGLTGLGTPRSRW